ncbi:putative virion-associated RNA polymerase subunit beta/beta' [Pseudomonas phage pPa_SNUABM_DT01]|nr:putative virion-associated RNA polymerase subunit beta/beta' [Pseudomonas phage pPa_SNUABM_DT01]
MTADMQPINGPVGPSIQYAEVPAKVWPMVLTKERVSRMTPVTSLDIYDGASSEFHDQGLYSTAIFGRVGSDERDTTFSYIDLKVRIFHPKIFRDLMSLKSIYRGICSGRETAIFDPVTKDFVADSSEKAETGYSFFVRHFPELQLRKSKSPTRQIRVEFINKWKDAALTRYIPVLPAGIRDIEIDDNGMATKNEIHDLYYRALSISNTIPVTSDMESPALDIARNALTNCLSEIYDLIEGMLAGKNGFILDKWASRRVVYGTRNVLTVMDTSIADLNNDNAPGFDATTLGLFQVIKGMTPLTIHHMRRTFGNQIQAGEGQAQLIDKKTLRPVWVTLSPDSRDQWTTRDGLTAVIDRYQMVEMRNRPVEIEDHYLALIYRGPDNTFRIFFDIAELPDHLDPMNVHPINLVELLYLCGYAYWNKYFAQICRYPISGNRSIYASRVYVKTTVVGERRVELNEMWEPYTDEDHVALEFPKPGSTSYMDTQSPHSTKLVGLQADFDGDTGSATLIMSKEAMQENDRTLRSRQYWVDTDGSLISSYDYDTLKYVVTNLTGRFKHGRNVSL